MLVLWVPAGVSGRDPRHPPSSFLGSPLPQVTRRGSKRGRFHGIVSKFASSPNVFNYKISACLLKHPRRCPHLIRRQATQRAGCATTPPLCPCGSNPILVLHPGRCLPMSSESCPHTAPRPGAGAVIAEGTPPSPLCVKTPPQGDHSHGAKGMPPTVRREN